MPYNVASIVNAVNLFARSKYTARQDTKYSISYEKIALKFEFTEWFTIVGLPMKILSQVGQRKHSLNVMWMQYFFLIFYTTFY